MIILVQSIIELIVKVDPELEARIGKENIKKVKEIKRRKKKDRGKEKEKRNHERKEVELQRRKGNQGALPRIPEEKREAGVEKEEIAVREVKRNKSQETKRNLIPPMIVEIKEKILM